jgi:hypothetical protein
MEGFTDPSNMRLSGILRFILCFLLLAGEPSSAGFLDLPLRPGSPESAGQKGYLIPNEERPQDAFPILRSAPQGVYIAPGTERAFIGAAASRATHLLTVDMDPRIVFFNQLNIILLRLAENREDYLQLRLHASAKEWSRRAEQSAFLTDTEKVLLKDPSTFTFWLPKRQGHWERFNTDPRASKAASVRFQNANYLYYDDLFQHLHKMARAGKMEARLLNLGNEAEIAKVADAIEKAGLKVGVLDISNAWEPAYLGKKRMATLLDTFKKVLRPDSLLMISKEVGGMRGRRFALQTDVMLPWNYYGFTMGAIDGRGDSAVFMKELASLLRKVPASAVLAGEFSNLKKCGDLFQGFVNNR